MVDDYFDIKPSKLKLLSINDKQFYHIQVTSGVENNSIRSGIFTRQGVFTKSEIVYILFKCQNSLPKDKLLLL